MVSKPAGEPGQTIEDFVTLAKRGTGDAVDEIMDRLNENMTIPDSKRIDFALGFVTSPEGVNALRTYLFEGTQVQRNYCALYFNRREDFMIVREAYDRGLIDMKQVFSR
ncbi:MAG: hypothetical protein WC509_08525 [Candidatus Izemoplasmatales bacterium]